MAIVLPLIFIVPPLVEVFALPASASSALAMSSDLLYLLGIPALVPATVAAYAVVGERQQGTLEPVLTTPIRREELLLGKALAALVPSLVVAYAVYVFFLACVALFAQPAVASAVIRGPDLLAQLVFTPLLASWSIWVGMAISARSSDVRVAQQLGALASLPSVVVIIAHRVQRHPRDPRPCPRHSRCYCSSSTDSAGGLRRRRSTANGSLPVPGDEVLAGWATCWGNSMTLDYVHGYSAKESTRLTDQATTLSGRGNPPPARPHTPAARQSQRQVRTTYRSSRWNCPRRAPN